MNGILQFQQTVLEYYAQHGRHDLPWRSPDKDGSFDPYKILVSEIMLQQTQVSRVIPKFESFVAQFPSFQSLAATALGDVLLAWSGLGYNRRAKFLWQAAGIVAKEYGGQLPQTAAELISLPGVGPNTAGAVLAYAYNQPAMFIETNIRTVFIHHFFAGQTVEGEKIHDSDVLEYVAAAVPDNPREWYWALMDYGTHLKETAGNLNVLSKHYTKQPAFEGSRRQIRGQILRLLSQGSLKESHITAMIADARVEGVLADLLQEGLVSKTSGRYTLPRA